MKLTLALQNEMKIKVIGNNIIEIDIPNECKRDLWKAQIECWLNWDGEEILQGGYLRIESNNRLKFSNYGRIGR